MNDVQGAKVDPVYGHVVQRFDADHAFALKRITEVRGFERLTREQMVDVANTPANIRPMGPQTNSSIRDTSAATWPGHSRFGPVRAAVRKRLLKEEQRGAAAVWERIQRLLKTSGGKDD